MTDFHASTSLLQLPAEHVSVLHGPARTGHVAIATRAPGWRERAIPVEDLRQYLECVPLGVDVYLSQARFRGWRRTQLLSSVNALWVDLDGPSRERTPAAALYALLGRCDEVGIPFPSYVLGTGRGLVAVWLVEVLPREVLPRWQALQAALVEHLRPLGADPHARDVARVLRLAGTLNTAPVPARLVRCLYPEAGSPHVYGFEALCEGVLLPLARPDRAREGAAPRARSSPRVVRLVRSSGADAKLWADRLVDLDRLRELRWFGALPPGHRDIWMFLAACALSWMVPASAVRREVRTLAVRAIGGHWGERETRVSYARGAASRGGGRPRRDWSRGKASRWIRGTSSGRRRSSIGWMSPSRSSGSYARSSVRRNPLGATAKHQARRAALGGRVRAERCSGAAVQGTAERDARDCPSCTRASGAVSARHARELGSRVSKDGRSERSLARVVYRSPRRMVFVLA